MASGTTLFFARLWVMPIASRNLTTSRFAERSCKVPFACTLGLASKPVHPRNASWCRGSTVTLSSSEP